MSCLEVRKLKVKIMELLKVQKVKQNSMLNVNQPLLLR